MSTSCLTAPEVEELRTLLTLAEQEELDRLLCIEEQPPNGITWKPFPGPQTLAFHSEADELFYGGAAGGGKTDLLLGLAFTAHRHSIIFRREYPQLKGIIRRGKEIVGDSKRFNGSDLAWRLADGRELELGAVQYEDDKEKYQGRPHDLKEFDELPHFTQSQYRYLIAWNRTSVAGQRCRVVATGNPPTPGQGEWVLQEWAPWLDPKFPHPAAPGELRWYWMEDGELRWLPPGYDGAPFDHQGETIRPRSRTYIPARVDDNPVYRDSNYKSVLQALPEPLRSQLLYGDFNATSEDDPWQTIPTAWVLAAQARWRAQAGPDVSLSCIGVDVARGGKDQTVLSPRFGNWFAELEKHPGKATDDGPKVAALVIAALGSDAAPVHIDPLNVGTSPLDILRSQDLEVVPINFGAGAKDGAGQPLTDRSGKYKFRNLRAFAYWSLREALDPVNGNDLALPDDRELLGDLCAPRYTVTTAGIQIESKEELKLRLGRSPDCGDALVMAHYLPPTNTWLPVALAGHERPA